MQRWSQREVIDIADRVFSRTASHGGPRFPSECMAIAREYCAIESAMHRLAEDACSVPERREGAYEARRLRIEARAHKWAQKLATTCGDVVRYEAQWDPRGVSFVVDGLVTGAWAGVDLATCVVVSP